MLKYRCELQRQNHAQARIIEAVASGYGGCKSEKGDQAMQRIIDALRSR